MARFDASFHDVSKFNASFRESNNMNARFGDVQVVETGNYDPLINKPRIEGNELIGDKTFLQLGLLEITPQEIDDMFDELIYGGN